ncbi:MAG: hypothetical protein R2880_02975 [Deinococcales bacterium]
MSNTGKVATSGFIAGQIAEQINAVAGSPPSPPMPQSTGAQQAIIQQGIVLRRYVELSSLLEAQKMVSQELGLSESMSLTNFVMRAAAKALKQSNFSLTGDIALVDISEATVRLKPIQAATQLDFMQLLQAIEAARVKDSAQADLLVADLSSYHVDEVMFGSNVPVLALGRIVNDDKSSLSTLSFSGTLPAREASNFLARVAKLLNEPVRLFV